MVKIPAFVTSIGDYVFYNCTSLTSVEIPNSVTSIGCNAFRSCTSLTSIAIPAKVTNIGANAFYGCTNIKDVYCYADPENLTWDENGCNDFKPGKATTCYVPGKYLDDYSEKFGESVNVTFKMNPELPMNPELSGGKCGKNAVWEFDPTTRKLTISGTGDMDDFGVGDQPWKDHKRYITSVVIEDGVTSIGSYAFDGYTRLKSITLPDSVTSIGNNAFRQCKALTSVEIPKSVTSIDSYAFSECIGLKSITIPGSVTSIGADAFLGCTNITDVYCNADPKKLTWYDKGCDDFKPGKATICHVPAEHLSYYKLKLDSSVNVTFDVNPAEVNPALLGGKCGENARWVFNPTTRKLTISGTGDMPNFEAGTQPWKDHMSDITSVVIEDGITSIGTEAFDSCAALTSIMIPDSVKSIGANAFQGCTSLTSVEISGSVTSIGDRAFYGCTSLASINIPESVKSIGNYAFQKCTILTSITLPDSVESIGIYAFSYCTSLKSIKIPGSVTSISNSAFSNCTSLTSVTIPDSVTSIGSYAFSGCTSLTSIAIPAKVTNIDANAFLGCKGIKDVYCYADPENLTWDERGCDDFKPGKETVCHVSAEHLGYYQTNFSHVNVKFVTDVTVTVAEGITNGTVTPDKTEVYSGATVTLTVAPETGYAVKSVTVNGTEITPVDGVYSFTVPAEDVTVSAEFEQQKCTVTLPEHMEIINGVVLPEGKADYGTVIYFSAGEGYTASNVKNGETELIPDVSGIYTVTVEGDTVITADIQKKPYELKAYGLRLNSDIGLDVYFSIDDSVINDVTRMDITLPNRQIQTVNAEDFDPWGNGLYCFSAKVAAKEMTDKVRFELYTSEAAPVYTADVSVRDAALQYLDSQKQTEKTKALVRAMLNYGAYSQEYFGYRTDDPAIKGEVLPTVDYTEIGTAFDNEKIKLPDDGSISFTGVNLALESNTSLVFTITNSSANTLTYELEGNTGKLEVKEEGNETKLIITDIPAENLADDFIVKIKVNGEGDYQVYYSPMTYARYCVKNNRAEKNVMLAFNEYCRCAKDYETK